MPASARLATVATVMDSYLSQGRRTLQPQRGLLLLGFEFAHALLERGELCLRVLEELPLRVEVLAHHHIHAVEPAGEERAQVLFDVLRRRVAQRLVNAFTEVVEESLVH